MDLIDLFKKEYNKNAIDIGVTGTELAKQRKNFQPMAEENEKKKKIKPQDFLKDKNDLKDILMLVKNKKLSANKTRAELKKMLEDPSDLNDFLNSLLKVTKGNKEETKEQGAVAAGGYSGQLFTSKEMKEEEYCDSCDRVKSKCVCNKPKKIETKEGASTTSSGQYLGPKMWAKSTKKKDWGPSRKTQIPGGKFVQVKKKCKKFPYCNQGDINALKIFENEGLRKVITNISESYGLTENYIRNIIYLEMEKLNKH
jgi:predicted transcriptional regulator